MRKQLLNKSIRLKCRFYRHGISVFVLMCTDFLICAGHEAMTCIIDLIDIEQRFATGKWKNSGHLEFNNDCCSGTDLSAVTFYSTVQEGRSLKLFLFPLEHV